MLPVVQERDGLHQRQQVAEVAAAFEPGVGVVLGDRVGELSTRRECVLAAFALGEPKPMEALAAEFEAGTLVIPDAGKPRNRLAPARHSEFERVLRDLSAAACPATDWALA